MNAFLLGLTILMVITGIAVGSGLPSPPHSVPSMLSERWTASDKPYKEVVDRLNERYARGESLEPLVIQYRTLASLHPRDPVAQFAYICADYAQFRSKDMSAGTPWSFVERLQQADPGNVHQFTRYRLIVSLKTGQKMPIPQIIQVGNRLLRYDPKDKGVRKALIDYLVDWSEGTQYALRYAIEGVELEPQSASAHSSLALAYEASWSSGRKGSKSYAAKAVAEYQNYLRLARPSDPFRQHAQYLIGVIKQQAGL